MSAYKKFVAGSEHDRFSEEFRQWYGDGKESLSKLESFVDYILAKSDHPRDLEWGFYNDLCSPCFVDYDFIGRYEPKGQLLG